jgi:hypothetical protein
MSGQLHAAAALPTRRGAPLLIGPQSRSVSCEEYNGNLFNIKTCRPTLLKMCPRRRVIWQHHPPFPKF